MTEYQTEYQTKYLGCGDCIHFDACARWNAGHAAEMAMCEHFKPFCENCACAKFNPNMREVECAELGRKTPRGFYCNKARVR